MTYAFLFFFFLLIFHHILTFSFWFKKSDEIKTCSRETIDDAIKSLSPETLHVVQPLSKPPCSARG